MFGQRLPLFRLSHSVEHPTGAENTEGQELLRIARLGMRQQRRNVVDIHANVRCDPRRCPLLEVLQEEAVCQAEEVERGGGALVMAKQRFLGFSVAQVQVGEKAAEGVCGDPLLHLDADADGCGLAGAGEHHGADGVTRRGENQPMRVHLTTLDAEDDVGERRVVELAGDEGREVVYGVGRADDDARGVSGPRGHGAEPSEELEDNVVLQVGGRRPRKRTQILEEIGGDVSR
mmetsp:Transcript_11113/g.23586  ORF Transcript_11113/g.23586 Transcript_11113/m.23586 type:complete len:232 (-) Transcript_11113:1581-2276(-)